jgi:hypothetical protein
VPRHRLLGVAQKSHSGVWPPRSRLRENVSVTAAARCGHAEAILPSKCDRAGAILTGYAGGSRETLQSAPKANWSTLSFTVLFVRD